MKRLAPDQVKIGFIGLGTWEAGSRNIAAKSTLERARTADVFVSCLTNDKAVGSVYTAPVGVFAGARQEPSC